jgi:hypothetical protein
MDYYYSDPIEAVSVAITPVRIQLLNVSTDKTSMQECRCLMETVSAAITPERIQLKTIPQMKHLDV